MSPTLNTNAHETKNAQFSNEQEPQTRPQVTHARMGYGEARLLLDRLHAEIKSVCEALKDYEGNESEGYSRSAALLVWADVPQDKVWENVNPGLDRILGFGGPQGEIVAMIHHIMVGKVCKGSTSILRSSSYSQRRSGSGTHILSQATHPRVSTPVPVPTPLTVLGTRELPIEVIEKCNITGTLNEV